MYNGVRICSLVIDRINWVKRYAYSLRLKNAIVRLLLFILDALLRRIENGYDFSSLIDPKLVIIIDVLYRMIYGISIQCQFACSVIRWYNSVINSSFIILSCHIWVVPLYILKFIFHFNLGKRLGYKVDNLYTSSVELFCSPQKLYKEQKNQVKSAWRCLAVKKPWLITSLWTNV